MYTLSPVSSPCPCISLTALEHAKKIAFAIMVISTIGIVTALLFHPLNADYLVTLCSIAGFLALSVFKIAHKILYSQTSYSPSSTNINIAINRRELNLQPLRHLQQLTTVIQNYLEHDLHVRFLQEPGVDIGPRRQYLDDLVKGVTDDTRLFKVIEESSLAVPLAGAEGSCLIFEQLGLLMSYCYGKKYPIGYHLDPSIFHVIFALTEEEIDIAFDSLPLERKVGLYRALLAAQDDHAHDLFLSLLSTPIWTEVQRNEPCKLSILQIILRKKLYLRFN